MLDGRCQSQHLRFVVAGNGYGGREARFSFGQRARLVEHDRIDALELLQCFRVLDEDASRRPAAGGHHDGHWSRQTERARTRDDQDRNRAEQGEGQPWLWTPETPCDECQHGNTDDDGDEPGGDAIGQPLDGRPRSLRLGHHACDLREQRVAADAFSLHDQAAGCIDGAAGELRGRLLLGRNRFTGHHRLIDGATAFDDRSVNRYFFSGTDSNVISKLHVGDGNFAFDRVANHARGFRRQAKQVFDRHARAAAGPQLEYLAEQHEHSDDGSGIEIRLNGAVHAEAFGKDLRNHDGGGAVEIRGADAEPDQREHVRAAIHERLPRAFEERPSGPPDHRRGEEEADPVCKPQIDPPTKTWTRDHVAHRQQHDGRSQQRADAEPPRHVDEFRIQSFVERDGARLERHAADRARARFVAHDLRMHRAGVVDAALGRVGLEALGSGLWA